MSEVSRTLLPHRDQGRHLGRRLSRSRAPAFDDRGPDAGTGLRRPRCRKASRKAIHRAAASPLSGAGGEDSSHGHRGARPRSCESAPLLCAPGEVRPLDQRLSGRGGCDLRGCGRVRLRQCGLRAASEVPPLPARRSRVFSPCETFIARGSRSPRASSGPPSTLKGVGTGRLTATRPRRSPRGPPPSPRRSARQRLPSPTRSRSRRRTPSCGFGTGGRTRAPRRPRP